jgi:toxin ParE1/3/4
MAEIVWRPSAIDDLDETAAYLSQFDPELAERYVARLVALGDSLAIFAYRGRPVSVNKRQMVLVRPYVLTYEIVDNTVFILRVRHGARKD